MSDSNGASTDAELQSVRDALHAYEVAHADAQVDVRRQNNVSIRIRIIDPDYEGSTRGSREPEVWQALNPLPDETIQNITMLLLLAPSETERSLANMEFDNPVPSQL